MSRPAYLAWRSGAVPDEQDAQIAYVYRDAISGDWLPHLSTELPEVFASEQLAGRPVFVLDRNTGRRQHPFVLQRTQGLPEIKKDALLTALKAFEHRRAQDRTDDELGEIDLSSLEFLSEVPQQAHLWTQVYKADGDLYPWLVADPWGIQLAMRDMRLTLAPIVDRHPHLSDWLDRRLSLSASSAGDIDVQARRLLEAEIRLGDFLPSLYAAGHAELYEHILRLLRLESRIKEDPAVRGEDLSAAAIESGNVLEALLQWVLLRWSVDASTWPEKWDRKTLRDWLTALPLEEPLDQACVGALESQQARSVRPAALRRDQPLKALFVAALLSVHEHEGHPLRKIPCTPLDWHLIGLRNKGGHASGVRLARDDVLALIEMSLTWCAKFQPYF